MVYKRLKTLRHTRVGFFFLYFYFLKILIPSAWQRYCNDNNKTGAFRAPGFSGFKKAWREPTWKYVAEVTTLDDGVVRVAMRGLRLGPVVRATDVYSSRQPPSAAPARLDKSRVYNVTSSLITTTTREKN